MTQQNSCRARVLLRLFWFDGRRGDIAGNSNQMQNQRSARG
jgi:hypothetical protein